jgi:hypothetical protein
MRTQMADEAPRRSPKTREAWLEEADRCEQAGELFRDIAMQGLVEYPDALALKHKEVLCLASTGATRQATEKFTALGLDDAIQSAPSRKLRMDIATLSGRLLKGEALAQVGEERRSQLREAARLYQAIFTEEAEVANPEAYLPGYQRGEPFPAIRQP